MSKHHRHYAKEFRDTFEESMKELEKRLEVPFVCSYWHKLYDSEKLTLSGVWHQGEFYKGREWGVHGKLRRFDIPWEKQLQEEARTLNRFYEMFE